MVSLAATLIVLTGLGAAQPYAQVPGVHAMTYRSRVDGSVQRYTLYLPKGYTPGAAKPRALVFFGVGYGGTARAPGRRAWADKHGWIFCGFDGRHNQHYYGIGEADFDQVLHQELAAHYPIDVRRVFFIGSSMGGTGAFGLGFRRPDWFAGVAGAGGFVDYDEFFPRWTEKPIRRGEWAKTFTGPEWQRVVLTAWSPVHTVESGSLLNPYIAAGELDPVNRTFASRRLSERLKAIGAPHTYVEVPGGKHGAGFDVGAMLEHFRTRCRPVDPWAPETRVATNRLEFGRNRWVRLTSLFSREPVSVVRAKAVDNGCVAVETAGPVRGFELTLCRRLWRRADGACVVRVNGRQAWRGAVAAEPIRMRLGRSGVQAQEWGERKQPDTGRKTAGREGPVNHVFATPFVVVYGTSGTPEETAANRTEAAELAASYKKWHHASITPVPDTAVDESMLQSKSLVLIGTQESNKWLERLAGEHGDVWPLRLTRKAISIRGVERTFDTDKHGVVLVHPSPWGGPYVLAAHGVRKAWVHHFGCFSLFWAPDYAVFTRKDRRFVEAGLFDETWRVPHK